MLEKNEYPMPFGTTPGVGSVDSVFSLKPKFQCRRYFNKYAFIFLVDLIKACDHAKHGVMSVGLKKTSATNKYSSWVKTIMVLSVQN